MKLHIPISSTLVAIAIFLFACKKENVAVNNGLIGKWRLAEIYNGYVNGGTYTWQTVKDENAHSLLFAADGQYMKKQSSRDTFPQCAGIYRLVAVNRIDIESSCQTVTETLQISELEKRSLVIDYLVREGTIRYKYTAE